MLSNVSTNKYNEKTIVLLTYLPVILAILIMLPRLISPKFGLFDDGKSIITAQRLASGDWSFRFDATDARFRPLYWLSFAVLFNIFGGMPLVFYSVNLLALCATTVLLITFLRRAGAGNLQAGLAGLFFVLSGPIIENYYTLSKGEWLQLLFICLSLWLVTFFQANSSLRNKVLLIVGASSALVCACLSKETSIVMFPISAVWFFTYWLWNKHNKTKVAGWRGAFFVASAIAIGVYLLLRAISISKVISVQGYTTNYYLTLVQIEASATRWTGWFLRDFMWVVPPIGLVISFIILRRKLTGSILLFEAFVWMGAWVCIYLPWSLMAEYYMLPFALGLAIFVSACVKEIAPAFRGGGLKHWLTLGITGLSGLLMIGALLNNLTNARVQLAIDSANTNMLSYLAQNAPANSTLYINIQDPNEYSDEIQFQLGHLYHRLDLKVITFQPDINLSEESGDIFIISPFVENQPLLTVRMGVIEASQTTWNLSLNHFLQSQLSRQIVFQTTKTLRLSDVNYPHLFCSLIKTHSFCALPVPFLDLRKFAYGWQVTELVQP